MLEDPPGSPSLHPRGDSALPPTFGPLQPLRRAPASKILLPESPESNLGEWRKVEGSEISVEGEDDEDKQAEDWKAEALRLRQVEWSRRHQIQQLELSMTEACRRHEAEMESMRDKLKAMATSVRDSISRQDEEATQEHQAMQEMFRQLSAARKAVATLKDESARAVAENLALQSRVASLEEQAQSRQSAGAEKRAETDDGSKKVKLAMNQMAKLIARHDKEILDWTSRCAELESGTTASARTCEALRAENAALQQALALLHNQEVISPPQSPSKCAHR